MEAERIWREISPVPAAASLEAHLVATSRDLSDHGVCNNLGLKVG